MASQNSREVVYPWNNDTFRVTLGFLTTYDLIRCTRVARQWRAWMHDEHIWKHCGVQWQYNLVGSTSPPDWMCRGIKTVRLHLPCHRTFESAGAAATQRHNWLQLHQDQCPSMEVLRIVSQERHLPVVLNPRHFQRIRALDVRGEWTVMESEQYLYLDVDRLESVILRTASAYDSSRQCPPAVYDRWKVCADALVHAPNLHELHLRCHFALDCARMSDLFRHSDRWGALRALTLEDIDLEDNITLLMLGALQGLESLKLDVATCAAHTAVAFGANVALGPATFPSLVSLELTSVYASWLLVKQLSSIPRLNRLVLQNLDVRRRIRGESCQDLETRWDFAWTDQMMREAMQELRLFVDHRVESQHLRTLGTGWKCLHTLRLHWGSMNDSRSTSIWLEQTTAGDVCGGELHIVSNMLRDLLSGVPTLTDLGLSGVHHVELQVIRALLLLERDHRKDPRHVQAMLQTLNLECSRISTRLMQSIAMSSCCNSITSLELTDLMYPSEFFDDASTQCLWSFFPRLRRLDLEVASTRSPYHTIGHKTWVAILEHTRGLCELNCAGQTDVPPTLLEEICTTRCETMEDSFAELNLLRTPPLMAIRFVNFLIENMTQTNLRPPRVVRLPYSSVHNLSSAIHRYRLETGCDIVWN